MKKGRLYTLIAFIILVLAGAAYTLNHLYEQEQQEEASYRTESPSTGDIVIKTVAAGSIQPRQEILIKPQISGIVRRVQVEAGELVESGWSVLASVWKMRKPMLTEIACSWRTASLLRQISSDLSWHANKRKRSFTQLRTTCASFRTALRHEAVVPRIH